MPPCRCPAPKGRWRSETDRASGPGVASEGTGLLALARPARLPGRRLASILMLGAVLGVLALAAFARFDDLGGAPLAEDEYYTARSIEWILADGVPAIPSGGYYVRAPLIQYAAAGFARLFGADAFAYRLPSALCGLLLGAIGFLYARRFGGLSLGLAVAAALLLSSWEIEFGRMARFYPPFEVAVLLFLIALDKAYFEARPGWRYLPHATLLLAALVHDLTLLLTPLLFLPLLPGCTRLRLEGARRRLGFAMASLLVTIGLAAMITGAAVLRDHGVVDPYPPDYGYPARMVGALATPVLPFFRLFPSPLLHLAAVGLMAAFLVAAFLAARRAGARKLERPDLLLALALLAGVFHLFAALALVLAFAFARYDLWRLRAQPVGRLVLLGATLAAVLGWLTLAVMEPGRLVNDAVAARWDVPDPATQGAFLRALWSTFFGWPDFYRSTLRPFAIELPELGLAVLAALGWFVVAWRHAPRPELLRQPAAVVLYWAGAMALFTVSSSTSRYWLPLLPVLYTLIALSLAEAATRWLRLGELSARRGAGIVFLLVFALGPDFQPRHILNVGADAVRYRTDGFARFADTWYPRWDVRTAAATLTRWHAAAPGARIVVDTLPALSYYLAIEHAVYLDRGRIRFAGDSREGGRREMWSDQRLLSTPEELLAYADPSEELWLVRATRPARRGADLDALPGGRLIEVGRAALGEDGRIELVRLRPTAARASRETP